MMSCKSWIVLAVLLHVLVSSAQALWMPQVFSSNMVLQRAPQQAQIWGSAAPGTVVTLNMDKGDNIMVFADKMGNWMASLPATMASPSHTLVVNADSTTVTFNNVAFGDVWICSGQSNMEFTVGDAFNASAEVSDSGNYPNLRLFTVKEKASLTPLNDTMTRFPDGSLWVPSAPTYVGGPSFNYFSATCYFFGRDLYKALGGSVPIGLIETCWGGTYVEAWTSPKGLATCGPTDNSDLRQRVDRDNEWYKRIGAKESADPGPNNPSVLFNGMIAPIINLRVTGSTWYQGEANAGNATNYACRFPAMITDWRQQFNNFNLHFYFVLLAAYAEGGYPTWPLIRQAQLAALTLPYVGVASAQDLGDEKSPEGSIHPRNKSYVGARLSLNAQSQVYAQPIVYQGPMVTDIIWPIDGQPIQTAVLRYSSSSANTQNLHLADTSGCTGCCANVTAGSPIQLITSDNRMIRANVLVYPDSYIISATVDLSSTPGVRVVGLANNWEAYSECAIYNSANLPQLPFNVARP